MALMNNDDRNFIENTITKETLDNDGLTMEYLEKPPITALDTKALLIAENLTKDYDNDLIPDQHTRFHYINLEKLLHCSFNLKILLPDGRTEPAWIWMIFENSSSPIRFQGSIAESVIMQLSNNSSTKIFHNRG